MSAGLAADFPEQAELALLPRFLGMTGLFTQRETPWG
jgi:hypothetical protein